ncbi:MAG: MBL fold metallo-hydrolase [Acidimicrobiales bacterium]|nr:MBL fold metallo-hydrolase [Acidimicrobiales bacterium]
MKFRALARRLSLGMCGNHDTSGHSHHLSLPVGRAPRIPPRQLHRRAFLGQFGRGVTALAVLGPVAAACGSSPDETAGSSTTAAPDVSGTNGDTSSGATSSTTVPEETTVPISPEGTWARANLGNVSAYVLARGNEAAIVDTGNPGSAEAIGQTVVDLGLNYSDVKHVILTHFHGDHVGSIGAVLDAAQNAQAYAGELDVDSINGADVTPVSDGTDIFGLQVIHTPGHTRGHISLWDELTSVLVAGDSMNGTDGGVSGANPQYTPDMPEAAQSILRMAEFTFDTVYFGHGEPVIGGADAAVRDLAAQL